MLIADWLKMEDKGVTDDTMTDKAMKTGSDVVRIKSERAGKAWRLTGIQKYTLLNEV